MNSSISPSQIPIKYKTKSVLFTNSNNSNIYWRVCDIELSFKLQKPPSHYHFIAAQRRNLLAIWHHWTIMTKHHFSSLFKSSCLRYIWKANSHRPATRMKPRHFAAKCKYFRVWHHLMTTIRWNESGRENNWMLMSQPTDINLRFFIVCVCAVVPGRCEIFYFQLTADYLEIGTDFAVSAVFLRMKSSGGHSNTPKRRKNFTSSKIHRAKGKLFGDWPWNTFSLGGATKTKKTLERLPSVIEVLMRRMPSIAVIRYPNAAFDEVTSHNFWFSSLVFRSLRSAPKLTWEIFLFAFPSFSHKNINFFSDEHKNSSLRFAPHKFWL